ncbi:MAG: acyl-CoA thioesterase [Pseudomonadota bacterium]
MTPSAPHVIEIEIEIPFHDLDPIGIVWHGHYVRYLEVARCALLERLGYNYDHMAASGYAWPVIDLQLRYIKGAAFKQKLKVRAEIVEWEHRLKIDYLITDVATGERMTKGYSVQVAVEIKTREMQLQSPAALLEKLGLRP